MTENKRFSDENEEFFNKYMNELAEAVRPFYDEKLGMRYLNKYMDSLSVEDEKIQRQRAFDLCTKLIDDGMNPYMAIIFINNNYFNPEYTEELGIPEGEI